MYRLICFLVLCIYGSQAQKIFPGKCKAVTPVQNYDITRDLGAWRLIESYDVVYFENGRCLRSQFTSEAPGELDFYIEFENPISGKTKRLDGVAVLVGTNNEALFKVSINGTAIQNDSFAVLDTDYDKYKVTFACQEIGPLISLNVVWILAREANPPAELIEKARAAVVKAGLPIKYLNKIDQNNCSADNL